MVNILQIVTSIDLGGAENVVFNIVEYCKKQHYDKLNFVVAELHSQKKPFSQQKKRELEAKNIQYISFYHGRPRISLMVAPIKLMFYIKKQQPDIVHAHTDLPDYVLATTLKLLSLFRIRKPRIIRTIHNTQLWSEHPVLGKYTEKMYINDCVIAVSEAALTAYNNLRIKYSLPASIYQHTIYNGCPVPRKDKHSFQIDNEKINIAFCGRFEYQKGIDILIERIKVINQRFKNLIFHLIGNGTEQQKIFELSKQFDNILLYDAIPDINKKLHAFDYIIMPSRFEGLGLVSVEASLAKVPVIASFAPGLDETLPNDWPLKFHLENEDELLVLFDNIVNQRYNLNVLREESFAFAYKKFSIETMIEKYSKIYLTKTVSATK